MDHFRRAESIQPPDQHLSQQPEAFWTYMQQMQNTRQLFTDYQENTNRAYDNHMGLINPSDLTLHTSGERQELQHSLYINPSDLTLHTSGERQELQHNLYINPSDYPPSHPAIPGDQRYAYTPSAYNLGNYPTSADQNYAMDTRFAPSPYNNASYGPDTPYALDARAQIPSNAQFSQQWGTFPHSGLQQDVRHTWPDVNNTPVEPVFNSPQPLYAAQQHRSGIAAHLRVTSPGGNSTDRLSLKQGGNGDYKITNAQSLQLINSNTNKHKFMAGRWIERPNEQQLKNKDVLEASSRAVSNGASTSKGWTFDFKREEDNTYNAPVEPALPAQARSYDAPQTIQAPQPHHMERGPYLRVTSPGGHRAGRLSLEKKPSKAHKFVHGEIGKFLKSDQHRYKEFGGTLINRPNEEKLQNRDLTDGKYESEQRGSSTNKKHWKFKLING